MLGNLDPAKMLIILVLALVVIGPERLPKVARQLGSAWRELTRVREQVAEEVRSAIPELAELPQIPKLKPGALSGFLNDLTRPAAATTGAAAMRLGDDGGAAAGEVATSGDGTAAGTWASSGPAVSRVHSPSLDGVSVDGGFDLATRAGVGLAQRSTTVDVAALDSTLDDPAMN
jgi:sec-independent protein translocase protein TatB